MIWLDAHLSPRVAVWLREELGHAAMALRELGLRDAGDSEIFEKAREQGVIMLTKDKDFSVMVDQMGPPPFVIWLRCGNTSEERLKTILREHLGEALRFIEAGECLVEIK